jgi:transcriptional regulator of acetoin/glycerol metabolism
MTHSDRLTLKDLPAQIFIRGHQAAPPFGDPAFDRVMDAPSSLPARGHETNGSEDSQLLLDEVIRRTLVKSLEQTQGNRRRAADLMGISRSTLYRMLARYGLGDKPEESESEAHRAPLNRSHAPL